MSYFFYSLSYAAAPKLSQSRISGYAEDERGNSYPFSITRQDFLNAALDLGLIGDYDEDRPVVVTGVWGDQAETTDSEFWIAACMEDGDGQEILNQFFQDHAYPGALEDAEEIRSAIDLPAGLVPEKFKRQTVRDAFSRMAQYANTFH